MADETAPSIGPDRRWRVELLGSCTASSGDSRIVRFPSRAVALLLARLSLRPRGAHGREELIELLWPGVEMATGRNRLRQALSTLRHLLEPVGAGAGTVMTADRSTVRLNANAVHCDALEFEQAAAAGRVAEARELYRGELLPGHFDGWVHDERQRLQALFDRLAPGGAPSAAASILPAPTFASGSLPRRPPEAPASAVAVHAPSYLSMFVGRHDELSRCAGFVTGHRLVTLTGAGGCGKTRLATELAWNAGQRLPQFQEIVFVELGECEDPTQLSQRLRVALRIPGSSAGALDLLAAHFTDRRVLVILDNFEQLAEAGGAEAVDELLGRLPTVHALVTSRRALQLPGEHELHLLPFEVPMLDDDMAAAASNPAVTLFVDRARGVRADFHLTMVNREDVLAVCRLLEGLPLALEIAASRVRTYALPEMRAELGGGFAMVARSAAAATRLPRHASLHAAIAWSWRLLTPAAQRFLQGLTAFRGGFDAAEAGAVTGTREPHALLDTLVRDSLVAVRPLGDSPGDDASANRFYLLESVRDFASGQADLGQRATLRAAHRQHFLAQATQLAAAHRTVPEAALGNLVEALRTGLDDGAFDVTVALLNALKAQWESVGTPPEVMSLMQRAAETVDDKTPGLSTFLSLFTIVLLMNGRSADALACGARALTLAGDDPRRRAEALFAHTRADWIVTREGSRVVEGARESVRLAQRVDARATEASALSLLGAVTLWGLDDSTAARDLYQRAEAVYVALGNRRGALQCWHGQMGCLFQVGRYREAVVLGERLERAAAELGNVEARLVALDLMTESMARLGRHDEAIAQARRAVGIAQRNHRTYNLVHAVWSQGRSLASLRRPEEAGVLMGFATRFWRDNLGPLGAEQKRELTRVRRLVRAQVGGARAEGLWAAGEQLPVREGLRRAGGV